MCLAEIEVAHRYKVLYVNTNCWSDDVRKRGYPEVFNTSPYNTLVSSSMAATLATMGVKRVVAFAENTDFGIGQAKLTGEFVWHTHDDTDELFLVIEGTLTIQLRDDDGAEHQVRLRPGQLYVVPRGVAHCPVTDGDAAVLLIEPAGVVNTGGVGGGLTAAYDDSLLDGP